MNCAKVIVSADVSDRVDKGDGVSTLDAKTSPSIVRRKRKQSQVRSSTIAEEKKVEPSNPRAVLRSSKTRNSKDQRISQGSKATKPILPRTARSFQNTPTFPSTETFLEIVIPNSEIFTAFVLEDKLIVPQPESRAVLSGLGDKYQTACHKKRTDNVVVDALGECISI